MEEGLIEKEKVSNINSSSSRYSDFKDSNNNEKKSINVKLTFYGYIIVIIYFFLNFINGVHWVTFASCSAKFGKFYHLDNYLVDTFSLLFMFLYPFGCVPEAYLIDNISMRIGLTISALFLIIGAFLKIFINTSIIFAYIGQFFTAIFQPAILNSPGKIASTWFDDKSRALVTSICCVSNTIGVMFGYIIHDFIIEENIVNPKIWRESFEFYLLIEFIINFMYIFHLLNEK